MKHTHYRRRSVFSSRLFFLILTAALGLGFYWYLGEAPAISLSLPDLSGPGQLNIQKAAAVSGIPCTLTQLDEDAVHTGDLILVNNKILYRFPEEQPLVSIYDGKTDSYYVRDREVELSPTALRALNRMLDDFREQGGSKTVNVVAGYRTEAFQKHLFDQSAQRNGQAHAEKYVAQPGGSEHHTGLVVDFSLFLPDGSSQDYDGAGEYAWINTYCQNYGWVVRYDGAKEDLTGIGDEPWHFRYVGVPHAVAMTVQGLCLEEYIEYLKNFPYDGQHLVVKCAEGKYEIWYCQGTAVYLPEEGEYTVSGNNVDGIVVTCKVE